ncbi:MAG: ABC transporter ATP-binding protein [Rouxiella badensis]|uniref:ABC-type dipeptide transporter n=1 Tax=Rouxiella badensis TaxID=1646377 RepID=A0A1X0WHX8_9GAMM|nr:ABC transporter ATP-binding protein [Rouxiella badensis]ORJ26313.1 ABC transporter ATP-binding protein [Rouxiella badensis]QII37690.1 ABC transporter ATP-binding protein [Rouxiella badensis]WAT03552.1 ABC transporter ATP-binding protein [Rouxiella badensis]
MTLNQNAAAPLLVVEDLQVDFLQPQGTVQAVKNISFQVRPGEIVALVGESGSGKSVTARTLVGLAGDNARVNARTLTLITHDGTAKNLLKQSAADWQKLRGREIGFVLQDALVSLDPLRTLGKEIAEPMLIHRLYPRRAIPAQVEALLHQVGIPDPHHRIDQYPHQLSGGLRQRALIASALAGGPKLLIADEPTTALDVTVQQRILAVFRKLAQAGHGVLLITHDLSVVAQVADRVVVMQQGEGVESGNAKQVLAAPSHPYTRRLLAAIPGADTRGRWLSGEPPLPDAPLTAQENENQQRREQNVAALDVRDVSVNFSRPDGVKHNAVNQVSLQLAWGETLGLVGESGSGKTTLGKVVLALQSAHRGEVWLAGKPWSQLRESERRPLRGRIQTITQDPLGSFDPQYTVEQIIHQPLKLRGKLSALDLRLKTLELLQLVGLHPKLLERRPQALSGGQRQRVSIAQALASDPEILVCDEPVSALDVTTQAQVLDLLTALQRKLGLAMLFISHDLGVVEHMSHRIAVMKDGKIVESGTTEQIIRSPQHAYTQTLLASVPAASV